MFTVTTVKEIEDIYGDHNFYEEVISEVSKSEHQIGYVLTTLPRVHRSTGYTYNFSSVPFRMPPRAGNILRIYHNPVDESEPFGASVNGSVIFYIPAINRLADLYDYHQKCFNTDRVSDYNYRPQCVKNLKWKSIEETILDWHAGKPIMFRAQTYAFDLLIASKFIRFAEAPNADSIDALYIKSIQKTLDIGSPNSGRMARFLELTHQAYLMARNVNTYSYEEKRLFQLRRNVSL